MPFPQNPPRVWPPDLDDPKIQAWAHRFYDEIQVIKNQQDTILRELRGKQISGSYAAATHDHPASDIVSGLLALARGGVNADLSATGGAAQVLKQASAGAAITVAALLASEIPNLAASKITSGTFADALIAASSINQHLSVDVTQASHGFSVGSPVYIDNTSTWNLAKADAIGTLAMGVVSAVSGDDFTVQFGGILSGLGSLSAGTIYYLSAATAGALVTTPPATATQFVQLVIHTTAAVRVLRLGQGMEVP